MAADEPTLDLDGATPEVYEVWVCECGATRGSWPRFPDPEIAPYCPVCLYNPERVPPGEARKMTLVKVTPL